MHTDTVVNDFFFRFGNPFQIHSDLGRNFETLLSSVRSHAYPQDQDNALQTISKRPSRKIQQNPYGCRPLLIDGNQRSWDLYLAQIALKSSINRHTGFTPNKMMLGREVNTPVYILFPLRTQETSADQYVAELEKSRKSAHEIARKQLKTSRERMKRDYDLKSYTRAYEVGDIVYLLDTAVVKVIAEN